ncbi:uncharacterized protein BO97DRAFT_167233 [Aspergillus homomorphus CBS 101889]|uniref:Uncharacterized protein n=1 Tax=Aspergillus homomorphus (strain CBS 101889) TaxID=1450537 RepID=A0A395HP16_ASPHC|nr:hypothetical protein BO97DRAFT_167233 [Aspergillus homomorphus CBS 101889]RAL09557.1 hypothetical protein BO97DRAFT_167233 [Aspergillus homomorphus CBS 101889]
MSLISRLADLADSDIRARGRPTRLLHNTHTSSRHHSSQCVRRTRGISEYFLGSTLSDPNHIGLYYSLSIIFPYMLLAISPNLSFPCSTTITMLYFIYYYSLSIIFPTSSLLYLPTFRYHVLLQLPCSTTLTTCTTICASLIIFHMSRYHRDTNYTH